jgi:hypothetical protein
MSDDLIGTCCAIAFIACLDVCSGICFDFASIRTSSFKFRFPISWARGTLRTRNI